MAEPSLSIDLREMIRWVLDYQGKYNWVIDNAEVPDINRAKLIVNAAYRDFINARRWSFLNISASVTTPSDGTYTVALPADFAQITGRLAYHDNQIRWKIKETSEEFVREYFARSTSTVGIPYLYALRPKAIAGQSQGYEFIFWPIPSTALRLDYMYRTTASPLVNLTDVPLGAAQHSDTIQAAVLAKCELLIDKKIGAMAANWKDKLADSIQRDAETCPAHVGYNGDNSDSRFSPPPGWGVDAYNNQPINA